MAEYNRDNKSQQMQQLRELVLGKDNSHVNQAVRDNARDIVSEVFSEALHDRQMQDGSVDKVIVPIVEKSVEKSVKTHSEEFVGYLYPLVGRLVRRSVSAFLNDFLEKTNELIENSFTFKGLKWRFKAWQSGVSFSQYVASQTFVYRVEQIFLIHSETGILLNSVSHSRHTTADADMVSGMLTAINDFVSDSFKPKDSRDEQQLDVVKTDDFTLLVKRAPKVMLVAAVTGNIPRRIDVQLEKTLEYVQKLFNKELREFDGDTVVFEPVDQTLRECLLSELKPEVAEKKKRPWFAWVLVGGLVATIIAYLVSYWQQTKLVEQISAIGDEPGITLRSAGAEGWSGARIEVLRDPDAISIEEWLSQQAIDSASVSVSEQSYMSLDRPLIDLRLEKVVSAYPGVTVTRDNGKVSLTGSLPQARRRALSQAVAAIPGLDFDSQMIEGVAIQELDTRDDENPAILQAMLDLNVAKIESMQLEFAQNQSNLDEIAQEKVKILASNFQSAIDLAGKLNLNVGLIIMGASDSVGNLAANQQLSRRRAQEAQRMLIELGIDPGYLNAIGLGVVEIKGSGARKVLFNVVYFET